MSTTRTKIKTIEELGELTQQLSASGKTVVQCHGVFDLLHVGHIRHFEEARALGDVLVVTLTPDRFVNKGPHRPAFPEQLRAETLAALGEIDYVAINDWPTAVEAIELIRPDIYAKGSDYSDAEADETGGIRSETNVVERAGGRVAFTNDITFSSSTLINRYLDILPTETQEYLEVFKARHGVDGVLNFLDGATNLKVLVIGETIIDEYQYCSAIGKSSKDPMLVVRLTDKLTTVGGILAVANHVDGIAGSVGMVTTLGDSGPYDELIETGLRPGIDRNFLRRPGTPTVTKRRIVEPYFDQKLLELYEMDDRPISPESETELCDLLERIVPEYDAVIVVDFGHGMLTSRSIEIICSRAKFLTLNVQSNAGNFGFNTISRYPRTDYLSITESELRLDAQDRSAPIEGLIELASERLGTRMVTVTRGGQGSLCYDAESGLLEVPALATQIVDRVGAGDAYLSIGSLCAAQNAPAEVVAFVGTAAAAHAISVVGNAEPVDPLALRRQIESLFK